jgi:hypothetical protein
MQLLRIVGKGKAHRCAPLPAIVCGKSEYTKGGTPLMAIEIMNDQGEFVPWEFADQSVKTEIEWALINGAPVTVMEVN